MGQEKGEKFMSYLNSVTIMGFVGADPEQRQTRNNNGSKFTVLSVATQQSWKNTGQNGTVGRNTFRAPRMANVDLALSKAIEIGEGRQILIRREAFNSLNKPQ